MGVVRDEEFDVGPEMAALDGWLPTAVLADALHLQAPAVDASALGARHTLRLSDDGRWLDIAATCWVLSSPDRSEEVHNVRCWRSGTAAARHDDTTAGLRAAPHRPPLRAGAADAATSLPVQTNDPGASSTEERCLTAAHVAHTLSVTDRAGDVRGRPRLPGVGAVLSMRKSDCGILATTPAPHNDTDHWHAFCHGVR